MKADNGACNVVEAENSHAAAFGPALRTQNLEQIALRLSWCLRAAPLTRQPSRRAALVEASAEAFDPLLAAARPPPRHRSCLRLKLSVHLQRPLMAAARPARPERHWQHDCLFADDALVAGAPRAQKQVAVA